MKLASVKSAFWGLTALLLSAAFAHAAGKGFKWENLQSDINGVAKRTDANLINPWGMAASTSKTIWVADNGTGVATVYNPDGSSAGSTVQIPKSASNDDTANPTGIVFNGTSSFKVTKNGNSQPATFIFVSEDGSISGWNATLDPANAILAVDNGGSDAVYKGVTIGTANNKNFLFVANFNSGKVEIYDENFGRVDTLSSFVDATLPAGYAPFNVRNFNNQIYVTYALQDQDQHDDVPGAGHGYIDVFDTTGTFVKRLVSTGNLNSPWGMAVGTANFGKFKGNLLVGNFGDGKINIYDATTGAFINTLNRGGGNPLIFDDLWDLLFMKDQLFFTAGIAHEADGLFGVITPGGQ